jgi:hypothetical protein
MGNFKSWLEYGGGGGAATALMHGGLDGHELGNTNMNIRSKTMTQNGRTGHADEDGPEKKPEDAFGFRDPYARKASKERRSRLIDKKRSIRDNRPDIVY